ncbi:RBBP9/YdeN family alpha/beta hydrolase [Asanoa iriomotensis]|uniref:RBBP9/YdeN family alpha/beta hydrolase n=1 Tax=Asanoa iriomotensis TaxID=234613 RepID=UPI0023B31539|nr:alpha/beta fold hydrolase [Asanoa iriomotensis]
MPGRGVALPDHWMRRFAQRPGFEWAPEPPGPPYAPDERVAALQTVVSAGEAPVVLVAHSAGCLTVALWAARHTGPVRGALLVTPPDVPPDQIVVPRTRLPFPSILVASRNDPYTSVAGFQALADDWGADLVDAGDVGHLDSATGFGSWPDGERLVARL